MYNEARTLTEGILFTDLYQLTMAQVYFRMGIQDQEVVFEHFFRKCPDYGAHRAGYCINAGLDQLMSWMRGLRFSPADLDRLRSLRGKVGEPLFGKDFLEWLTRHGNFDGLSLRAVPEGRVVHPRTPVTVVTGPMAMSQILETALLNKINYQILVATKASRMREVCGQGLVIDFGMRRGQDNGANAAARAAMIGGVDFTSNVGMSFALGHPPKGTHAHSMVQAFMALGGSELDAFRAYADSFPNDCLLLVDTIDTLHSGVPNAILVFEELRRKGHQPLGIRLDSGDLAHLSFEASRILDQAGFGETSIVLSGDLDEVVIVHIHQRIRELARQAGVEAQGVIGRLAYGIGTRLVTSHGCCALGGVYKLAAIRREGQWQPSVKVSDDPDKTPVPGIKQLWRLHDQRGMALGDLMAEVREKPSVRHALHQGGRLISGAGQHDEPKEKPVSIEPLLEDVMHQGCPLIESPNLDEIRARRVRDLASLDPQVKQLVAPKVYPVYASEQLWGVRESMLRRLRAGVQAPVTAGLPRQED